MMLLNQGFLVDKWKSSLRKFDGRHNDLVNRYEIFVPLVVSTFRSCPHSWLITEFVTGATWWVPLVLPGHLTSPRLFQWGSCSSLNLPGHLTSLRLFQWGSCSSFILPGHLTSSRLFHWGRVPWSFIFCVVFCISFLFGSFLFLVIVWSVLRFTDSDYLFWSFLFLVIVWSVLRFTDSDYPFDIFTLLI